MALTITRIDAARRQLECALQMWIDGGDPVSVHSLVGAAYQIVHDLNRKAKGPPLLLDSPAILKSHRKEAVSQLKSHFGFFKHADERKGKPQESIDFDPGLSELFFLGTVLGLEHLAVARSPLEDGFLFWCALHRETWLSNERHQRLIHGLNTEQIARLRDLQKRDLFLDFGVKL